MDSGVGDLRATANAQERAERIVLPGVGAFVAWAPGIMAVPDLRVSLEKPVICRGAAFLGMRLLGRFSAAREPTVTRDGFGSVKGGRPSSGSTRPRHDDRCVKLGG